mmetsp:Transcript_43324/g.68675  ORF Transcript_43324/g.68675 Transcript_43324/m.68675 type:complete len:362 (-) Transcript_43324:7-1092(-)
MSPGTMTSFSFGSSGGGIPPTPCIPGMPSGGGGGTCGFGTKGQPLVAKASFIITSVLSTSPTMVTLPSGSDGKWSILMSAPLRNLISLMVSPPLPMSARICTPSIRMILKRAGSKPGGVGRPSSLRSLSQSGRADGSPISSHLDFFFFLSSPSSGAEPGGGGSFGETGGSASFGIDSGEMAERCGRRLGELEPSFLPPLSFSLSRSRSRSLTLRLARLLLLLLRRPPRFLLRRRLRRLRRLRLRRPLSLLSLDRLPRSRDFSRFRFIRPKRSRLPLRRSRLLDRLRLLLRLRSFSSFSLFESFGSFGFGSAGASFLAVSSASSNKSATSSSAIDVASAWHGTRTARRRRRGPTQWPQPPRK